MRMECLLQARRIFCLLLIFHLNAAGLCSVEGKLTCIDPKTNWENWHVEISLSILSLNKSTSVLSRMLFFEWPRF